MSISVWQDIIQRKQEITTRAWLQANAPEYILKNLERGANEPWVQNADGLYYHDTRQPFLNVADSTITLSTASLMLHRIMFTSLPANYFTPGKKLRLVIWGAWTTAATPGNVTVECRFGTGDNTGTILATTSTIAGAANKTSITTKIEAYITCRLIGASGSLLGMGMVIPDQTAVIIPAANNPWMLPASAPAATTVDTTAASGINLQMKRSGSTAETWITHDLTFEALN